MDEMWAEYSGRKIVRTTPSFVHHSPKAVWDDTHQADGDVNANAKLALKTMSRTGWRQVSKVNPGWDVILTRVPGRKNDTVVAVIYSPRLDAPTPVADLAVLNHLYAYQSVLEDVGFRVELADATSSHYAYLIAHGDPVAPAKAPAPRPAPLVEVVDVTDITAQTSELAEEVAEIERRINGFVNDADAIRSIEQEAFGFTSDFTSD